MLAAWILGALAVPAMAPSPISRVPIDFREGLIWVEIRAGDRSVPFRFLLDSGASHTVLDLRTARELGLARGPAVPVRGVGSRVTGFGPVPWKARLGDTPLSERVLILDLGPLSEACDRRVDGLIGADFFRDRVVEIDYDSGELRLWDDYPPSDVSRAVPMTSGSGGFSIPGSVNGSRNGPLRIDTGCATALHWVSTTTPARTCPGPSPTGLSRVSIRQTLAGVRLGPHHVDTVPTGIHRTPIFDGESGLLGNGLLAMFGVVTFDTRSHQLHLGPRERP
ncbi:MAG: clan AA aspartic protease [Verrucomicrobiales bacterium]|nr:clan AA aspartic protease [Verrucomicrobiales bacterium]